MVKNNDQIICPVCGKVGIKDFHQEDVVCPCCGTDLSIYRMLHEANKASQLTVPSGFKMEDYHSGLSRCGTCWCFIFNALRETINKAGL